MTSEKGCKKEKNQNIQVFVRLRPLNQRERDIKSLGVIEVIHNREVVVHQGQSSFTKKFTYDRAFGPNAKQVEVYQEVVSPLIEEVLNGYNCTVFAYGQTGTGKTHTMVGENSGCEADWQSDPLAGIIPRALSQLFDELRTTNTEYTVRVSYLELYNEELFDLLSSTEDNSKLRIYEDVTRKGSNIVNGLEEITVYNKNEVYKIMAQGQERKKVASTLMNAQSSRSHTVFTIVVHMKENSPEGEELVKIGKLNLVDLAGSENISKAGSDNPAKKERARECVNINQSLLTLGRVITALVERHPHIPYRESKLTRILQESLGGRTKTSIIATISPGHKDLEETMSTLEYAYRAKNIQNKPEVNQKMTKKAILKEYSEEIDRLKRDLQAARDKSGVYLPNEVFAELTLKQEEQRKEIQELLLKKRAMEDMKEKLESVFSEVNKNLEEKSYELKTTKMQLAKTSDMLRNTKLVVEETAHLVEKQQATEEQLSAQARALLAAADVAASHVHQLHDTVDKRRQVESANLQTTRQFRQESTQHREHIAAAAKHFTQCLGEQLNGLQTALETFAATNSLSLQDNNTKLEELVQKMMATMNEIKSVSNEQQSSVAASCSRHASLAAHGSQRRHEAVTSSLTSLLSSLAAALQAARGHDVTGTLANFVSQWYAGASARVASLQNSHAAFQSRIVDCESKRSETARKHRDTRRANTERKSVKINACIAEIEEDKAHIESRLSQQLTDIEAERIETENRLQLWVEEERRIFEEGRRLFEQRLQAHVDSERAAMELRLSKKTKEIETERVNLESRVARLIEWQQLLLQSDAEELQQHEHQLCEVESEQEESLAGVRSYDKEFGEGASAISTDMEVFSQNVVQVVQHIHTELLRTLDLAKQQIEKQTQAAVTQDAATSQHLIEESNAAFEQVLADTKHVIDSVLTNVEVSNTSTINTITAISTATTNAISQASELQCQSHGNAVQQLHCQLGQYSERLQETVRKHEELEGRYLSDEYKVYEPTGGTPRRMEYRYPRALAATSPHHRILDRYRRTRAEGNSCDEECILVESDTESVCSASEMESLASEEFAVPTPRGSPPHSNGHHPGIVKCTSESDLYFKRKEELGKENENRSMIYKKPSKLPAPSTHKKPLVIRNN